MKVAVTGPRLKPDIDTGSVIYVVEVDVVELVEEEGVVVDMIEQTFEGD